MSVLNKQELVNKVNAIAESEIPIESLFSAVEQMLLDRDPDPLYKARLRGLKIKRELLFTEGKPFNSEEVASLLGMSRQAVDKRRKQNRLLALSLGKRGYRFPAWQFTSTGTLPGLEKVLEALSHISDWGKLEFFLTGDIRLEGNSPLECLRLGDIESVIRVAKLYGEQSAA